MKLLLLSLVVVFGASTALADHQARLLKIDCEPSIQQFSVRPISTWSWGIDYPEGYVDVEQGLEVDPETNEVIKDPGSDVLGSCTMSLFREEVVFEVIRAATPRPIALDAYHNVNIDFRLNGEVFATGLAHSKGGYWIPTVLFDASGLTICQIDKPSFSPHGPSAPTLFDKHCEWMSKNKLLERMASGVSE